MAYKIYLRDGGLNTSPTIPPGYTALGSDSGDIKKKVVDTVSDVGGGSGSYFKYVTTINTFADGATASILYSDIVSGGSIPSATSLGGSSSDNPYIDFNIQVYFPIFEGAVSTNPQIGWIPILINTKTYDATINPNLYNINGVINVGIDMYGNILFTFDFAPYETQIPIRVVITA
jgi:hypothetical protein